MDDLEFRRRIFADPDTTDEDIIRAAKDDPAKEALWQEEKKLQRNLKEAAAIPVPEELRHKLMWQHTANEFVRQKKRQRWYVSIAASIAFVLGIGVTSWMMQTPQDLSSSALAHVRFVDIEKGHSALPVDLRQVNAKLASFGAHFSEDIGNVTVVNYCHLNAIQSLHLILDTPEGKMSVFVVPHRNDTNVPASFADENFEGKARQFQQANIMVVGEKGADLAPLMQRVEKNLRFST